MKKSLITGAIALALLSSVAQATEVTTPVTTNVAAAFEINTAATIAVLNTDDMKATAAGELIVGIMFLWFAYGTAAYNAWSGDYITPSTYKPGGYTGSGSTYKSGRQK